MHSCPPCHVTRELISNISRSTRASCVVQARGLSSQGFATAVGTLKKHDIRVAKPEALTILHKATKILPRVLASTGTSGISRPGETVTFWNTTLSEAHEDLSARVERPAKIAVFGVDEWSGSTELVTALLADPLSSNAAQNQSLINRWKDNTHRAINISHGTDQKTTSESMQYPSNFLAQFKVPIEIKEFGSLPPSSFKCSSSIQHILEDPALYEADISLIVCNPLTTPLSTIIHAQLPSNAIVVLTTTIPQVELDAIIRRQKSHSARLFPNFIPDIIVADPQRALQAIQTLQADPSLLSAIQRYRMDFVGSHVSRITHSLRKKLEPEAPANTVRAKLALERVSDVLQWALDSIHQTRQEIDNALIDTSRLREKVEETRTIVERDLFGRFEHASDKMVFDEVDRAIKQSEKEMRIVMDRLTWWRIVWSIDELSDTVGSAVIRTWCNGLEGKLILQTGRLAALQDSMSQSGFALLSKHSKISTATLQNDLLQLKSSPNHRLTVESLTHPLVTRRDQIIAYPTSRLHVTGQRAALGMSGGILSGIGISWAGWLGWLLGSGESFLGYLGMDTGTAIGVGMLSALGSIRWAVGKWEKGKNRWWQDWSRVTQGLERDLKSSLCDTMQRQVAVVAETATEGLSKLAESRKEGLAEIEEEVNQVQSGLDTVMRGVGERS